MIESPGSCGQAGPMPSTCIPGSLPHRDVHLGSLTLSGAWRSRSGWAPMSPSSGRVTQDPCPAVTPAPSAEPLPAPSISTSPVSWITPGLNTTLLCLSGLRGVTFLLRLEGEDQFLEVAEAPEATQATFPVHRAGNYSCSYRTHAAGTPSEPSATVTIEELGEWVGQPRGLPGGGGSWRTRNYPGP